MRKDRRTAESLAPGSHFQPPGKTDSTQAPTSLGAGARRASGDTRPTPPRLSGTLRTRNSGRGACAPPARVPPQPSEFGESLARFALAPVDAPKARLPWGCGQEPPRSLGSWLSGGLRAEKRQKVERRGLCVWHRRVTCAQTQQRASPPPPQPSPLHLRLRGASLQPSPSPASPLAPAFVRLESNAVN